MTYNKRILYMDYYENEVRQANAGFVKLTRWKKREEEGWGKVCMQLYISDFPLKEFTEGTVKLVQGEKHITLEQIKVADGKGMIQIEDLEEILEGGGIADEYKEVLLRVDFAGAGCMECVLRPSCELPELCQDMLNAVVDEGGVKTTEDVIKEMISMDPEVVQASEDNDEPESEDRKALQIPQKLDRMKHDKWRQLEASFPHIRPFDDERDYLKADLKDMTVLSDIYYRLVDNSFLLHGYFNYGHLILTKINKRGSEKVYLGVPGNYYDREAQVAVMFGFESFEPKTEPASEGDFGYYMIGVKI